MMRWTFPVSCLILLLAGCAPVQVIQDYMPGYDFASYHTYRWKDGASDASSDYRANSPLLQERFRRAIEATLSGRGYARAAVADFTVSYEYSVQTKVDYRPYRPSVGIGYGRYYDYGFWGVDTDYGIYQYDVGVLVIDFFDSRTGEAVWRGTGSQLAPSYSNPEEVTTYVQRMVAEVLAQFPPDTSR